MYTWYNLIVLLKYLRGFLYYNLVDVYYDYERTLMFS